jgi:xanthine dehydrogenase small subunit
MDVLSSEHCASLGTLACEDLVSSQAVQCGYCTPGAHVSLCAARLGASSQPASVLDIEDAFDGLLCRCTGYRPLLEAASRGPHAKAALPPLPSPQQQQKGDFRYLGADGVVWLRPASLASLCEALSSNGVRGPLGGNTSFPRPQIVLGNTDLGYHERYHPSHKPPPIKVSPLLVPELSRVYLDELGRLRLGAGCSIERVRAALLEPRFSCEAFRRLSQHLAVFANRAVRSVGTVGGSVMACDHLSDLLPPLRALEALLLFQDGVITAVGEYVDRKARRVAWESGICC